jgi:hypothetical protein
MNYKQCKTLMIDNELPFKEYMFWSHEEKQLMCREYFNLMEERLYAYNPFSEDGMAGLRQVFDHTDEDIGMLRDNFYFYSRPKIRELVEMVIEDAN